MIDGSRAVSSVASRRRHPSDLVGRVLVLAGLVAGLGWLVHAEYSVCPFANLSGHPCPGCGLTRASLALLQADIQGAFALHPLAPICAPLIAVVGFGAVRRFLFPSSAPLAPLSIREFLRRHQSVVGAFWFLLGVTLIAVWILRFFGWFGGAVEVRAIIEASGG